MAKPDLLSQKILTLLKEKHLLSAQELIAQLEKKGTSYNKTSVYRSLEKLLSTDAICRHEFAEGATQYELQDTHHDHAVCTQCGSVTVVNCKVSKTIRIVGFSIKHHHATFFGLCKKCRASN